MSLRIRNLNEDYSDLSIKSDNNNFAQIHLKNYLPENIALEVRNLKIENITNIDVSQYVQKALFDLEKFGGGVLFVDPGIYPMKSSVSLTISSNKNISIIGTGGKNNCVFDFYNTTNGFVFTCLTGPVNFTPSIEIRNLSLLTCGVNLGNAISVNYNTANVLKPALVFSNLYIAQNFFKVLPPNTSYGYWGVGIALKDGRTVVMENIAIIGEWDVLPGSFAGIVLCGEMTSVKINQSYITECSRGITSCDQLFNTTEGVFITDTDIVYCDYGIQFEVSFPGAEPQISILNCALNTSLTGVIFLNYQQSFISNTLFYASSIRSAGAPVQNQYTGIFLGGQNNAYHCICNNIFNYELSGNRTGAGLTGIDVNDGLTGGSCVSISENIFFGFTGGVQNLYNFPITVRSNVKNVVVDSSNIFRLCAGLGNNYVFNDSGSTVYVQDLIQNGITSSVPASGSLVVNFTFNGVPNPFPNFCKSVIVTPVNASASFYISNITSSSFTIHNTNLVGDVAFNYIATGS